MPNSQPQGEQRRGAKEGTDKLDMCAYVGDTENSAKLEDYVESKDGKPNGYLAISVRFGLKRLDSVDNIHTLLQWEEHMPAPEGSFELPVTPKRENDEGSKLGKYADSGDQQTPSDSPLSRWDRQIQVLGSIKPSETPRQKESFPPQVMIRKISDNHSRANRVLPDERDAYLKSKGRTANTIGKQNGGDIEVVSPTTLVVDYEKEVSTTPHKTTISDGRRTVTEIDTMNTSPQKLITPLPSISAVPQSALSQDERSLEKAQQGCTAKHSNIFPPIPNVKFRLLENPPQSPSISRTSKCRTSSDHSSHSLVRKPSTPFRSRRLMSDGTLELKAGRSQKHVSVETPTVAKKGDCHQRPVSLNLPINIYDASLPPSRFSEHQEEFSVHEREERELEYKHRHTFIGTASLDDFLELLEISPTHTTTKQHVTKAFITLASNEQLLARKTSSAPDGWEVVKRITSDMVVGYADYLCQAQVKLGSVSLGKFLEMMSFDEKEKVEAMSVIEAFSAASHLDGVADAGVELKARDFRSWMVKQGGGVS